MSVYRVLKPVAFTKEDGSSAMSAMPGGKPIEIADDEFAVELVAEGRIEALDGEAERVHVDVGDVELADAAPSDGKPGESATNADLVEYLVSRGVKRAAVANLAKPALLEAIDRLTHTDDDD